MWLGHVAALRAGRAGVRWAETSSAPTSAAPTVVPEGQRHAGYGEEAGLFVLAALVFLAGWVAARWSFGGDGARAAALAPKFAYARRLLHRKWYVDELYDRLVIHPFYWACDAADAVDKWVVDGAVNFTAAFTEITGQAVKLFQSGVARHYALWLLGGAVLVLWMLVR